MSRDRNKCEIIEIERMAGEIDRILIEAEIRQPFPKKHPSIVRAEAFYNAGYRKQNEGEWEKSDEFDEQYGFLYKCSVCDRLCWIGNYCPNCGAKMKGE